VIKEYFNEKAAVWDETASEKDTTKLEKIADRIDIMSGDTVLDVGTGTGVFLPYLLQKVGESGRIIAMDFAEEMLKIAASKCINGNVEYLCADVCDIPGEGESFDCVVCYSSFPHFQDKPGALAEIMRVLKAGGRLYICHTSSRRDINEIHRRIPVVKDDVLPGAGEMLVLLANAGFTGIEVQDGKESYFAGARKP
jgi:ubiquinone/menaquinone biosynthesis C-methylase UbiE